MRYLIALFWTSAAWASGSYTCVNSGADPSGIQTLLTGGGVVTITGPTCAMGSSNLTVGNNTSMLASGTVTMNGTGKILISGNGVSGTPNRVNGFIFNGISIETTQTSTSVPQSYVSITNNTIQNVTNGNDGIHADGYWSNFAVTGNSINTISTVPFASVTSNTNAENGAGGYACSWSGGTNNCFGAGLIQYQGMDHTTIQHNSFNFTLDDAMHIVYNWGFSTGTSYHAMQNNDISYNTFVNIHRMGFETQACNTPIGACSFGLASNFTGEKIAGNYNKSNKSPYGNSYCYSLPNAATLPTIVNNACVASTGPMAYGYEMGQNGLTAFQGNTATANTGSSLSTYIITGPSTNSPIYKNNYLGGAFASAYFGTEPGCTGCWTQQYNATAGACDVPSACDTSNVTTGSSAAITGTTAVLSAYAISELAIQIVQFKLDGTPVATQEISTINTNFTADRKWLYSHSFTGLAAGSHTVQAIATDVSGGASTTSQTFTIGGGTPTVSLSTTSINFGAQTVLTTSSPVNVTLTNTGSGTLALTLPFTVVGDYGYTSTCGATVAAAGSCLISITFTPTVTGTRTGSVSITDNAAGSPHVISLIGLGTAPVASCVVPVVGHPHIFPNVNYSFFPYNDGTLPGGVQVPFTHWAANRFDYMVAGGLNLGPAIIANGHGNSWMSYTDSAFLYAPQIDPYIHDLSAVEGFFYEDVMLHMNADYIATQPWQNLDQFDFFEQFQYADTGPGNYTFSVNGAFTLVGTTYTDVTVNLYDNAHFTTVSDRLLLGYSEPFDLATFTVSTARVGGTASYQYWNGSAWTALTAASDTSSGLTATGTLTFNPPANWAKTVVHGSRAKYWIQATVAGASTNPILQQVHGDNWISHSGSNNSRGWSPTASGRINIGLGNLEYNPTPPSTQTARFRYQARATSLYAPNTMFGNPGNIQGGLRSWGAILKDIRELTSGSGGANAAFFDDGESTPNSVSNAAITSSSDVCPAGGPSDCWKPAVYATFTQLNTQLHIAHGSSFVVGVNTGDGQLMVLNNFGLLELAFSASRNGNLNFSFMDAIGDPTINPLATDVALGGFDNRHFGTDEYGGVQEIFEQGTRSITALMASYYIGANPNLSLVYNSLGYNYFDSDEVYVWSPTTTTLSASLGPDTSTGSKTISLVDGSAITLPGGPVWTNPTVATNPSDALNIYGYAFRIGGNDVIQPFKDSTNSYHTFTPVHGTYAAGATVEFAIVKHLSVDATPAWPTVFYWSTWAPFMGVDLGPPDTAGYNGGVRDTNWIPASGAVPEFWRRDFTKAIIIDHVMHDYNDATQLQIYSPSTPIALGGTYYPLNSDGTTGSGITTLQLRAAEAAILMKSPLP